MARRRKTHRICKTTKINSNVNTDAEIDINPLKNEAFCLLNSRKICVIRKYARIYKNVRKCVNNGDFLNRKCLSSSILTNGNKKNWIRFDTKSTQTGMFETCEKTSSTSTQTEISSKENKEFLGNNYHIKKIKSESCISSRYNFLEDETKQFFGKRISHKIPNLQESENNLAQPERIPPPKVIITLHKNQNINSFEPLTPTLPKQVKNGPKPASISWKNRGTKNVKPRKGKRRKIDYYRRKLSTSNQGGNNLEGVSEGGVDLDVTSYDKFMTELKKYSALTVTWSFRMFQIFADLGSSLKLNLTNLYKQYETLSAQRLPEICKCEARGEEIDRLTHKINQLESNLETLKIIFQQNSTNTEKMNDLVQKVERLSKNMEPFGNLRSELETLKKQWNCGNRNALPTMGSFPPPPPPLPPPPMPTSCHSTSFIRVLQNDRKLRRFDSSRPIITLEDILKVKLKKISMTNL